MRISLLLICIIVAIVLGLIFGWLVRGRIAERQLAKAEEQRDRPIRSAVVGRVRSGLRDLLFGGGKSDKAKAKPKPAPKPASKKDESEDDSKT